ncbi:hypothetical protein HY345_02465 [Candidatus Microgenomates bacterium]|nr:hypothetical protein [Candidatus Microgenomates bacterium]
MGKPLSLVADRASQSQRCIKLNQRVLGFGTRDLTLTELKEYEVLQQRREQGQFAAGLTDNRILAMEQQRKDKLRENYDAGRPLTKLAGGWWGWNQEKREYAYRGVDLPRNYLGAKDLIKLTLEDLTEENSLGERGRTSELL